VACFFDTAFSRLLARLLLLASDFVVVGFNGLVTGFDSGLGFTSDSFVVGSIIKNLLGTLSAGASASATDATSLPSVDLDLVFAFASLAFSDCEPT
jgi:hypothetical protein